MNYTPIYAILFYNNLFFMSIDLHKKDLVLYYYRFGVSMVERLVSNFLDSNVFVISHKNECIIVDAGAELGSVEAVVGDKKVLAILLTHGHYDHCFYVEDYARKYGCKIYASKFICEYLQNPAYNYSDGALKIDNFSQFVFLEDEGKLSLGDFQIFYTQLGGHSKSDMVFAVDDDIFVGDLLIGRDIGRIDLYGGSKTDMQKSLEFLAKQKYNIMHSGHFQDNDKKTQDKVVSLWLKFLSR